MRINENRSKWRGGGEGSQGARKHLGNEVPQRRVAGHV